MTGQSNVNQQICDMFIVYDSASSELRRTCFWTYLEDDEPFAKYEFDYVSISESIRERENPATQLFNRKSPHSAVLINWDAINTDIVYGSRDSLNFFEHYVPDMDRWVQDGNVVIVEEQSAARIPLQRAYDPFTFTESMEQEYDLSVQTASVYEDPSRVFRTDEHEDHPLVAGLNRTLTIDNASVYRHDWFPHRFTKDLASLDDYESRKKMMYVGWFDSYDDAWVPLIFADEERTKPTLLCRFVSGDSGVGAYIVSTMYLGSTEQTRIVENALSLDETAEHYLQEQAAARRQHKRRLVTWSAVIAGAVVFLLVLVGAYLMYGMTPTGIVGAIVSGVVSAIVYIVVDEQFLSSDS